MTDTTAQFFTGAFKARNRLVASAAMVLASAAPFALGLIVITFFVAEPTSWVALLVTAGAFLLAGGFTWLVQDRFALLGNDWLRAKLRSRLGDCEDLKGGSAEAAFVGFGPSDDVLVWDGETDLDVGFLSVAESAMVFLGDRFTWSLSKDRIDRIDLTPAPMGPRRIIIRWHAPREPGRAFTLESREARSLREADTETVNLFRDLRKWSLVEPPATDRPPTLGHPPTEHYDGRPIGEPGAGWCATTLGMMVIIVLTIWYLAGEMLEDGYYYHAVLWAGFVFVGGAVFTRCLLHYLQSTSPPPGSRRSRTHS